MRAIFTLYLEYRSVDQVLAAVQARSWRNKRWTAETDSPQAGRPFTKASLGRLLSNVLYIGQVRHEGKTYRGEQASIIEESAWRDAQKLLVQERGCRPSRNKTIAMRTGPGANVKQDEVAERVPRIARLMALALKFEQMIRQSVVLDYAVLAAVGRVSRARVTQIMNLLNLAPDIQEQILFLRWETAERCGICEQTIRRMSSLLLWSDQRARWAALISKNG